VDRNSDRISYQLPYYVMTFLIGISVVSCSNPNSTSPRDNTALATAAVIEQPNTKALTPVSNLIQSAIWNDDIGELVVSVSLLVSDIQVKIFEAESLDLIDERDILSNEVWQSKQTTASLPRIPCRIQVNTQTRSQSIDILNAASNCGDTLVRTTAIPISAISSPASNMTITIGTSQTFTAVITDPYNNGPYSYIWNYGGAAVSVTGSTAVTTVRSRPITFNRTGSYTVSFRAADRSGIYPTQASSRVIIVTAANTGFPSPGNTTFPTTPPATFISSPNSGITITTGKQIIFSGQIQDNYNVGPYGYSWDFYYGSTYLKSVPGTTSSFSVSTLPVIFVDPGSYRVAFKAKTAYSAYNTNYPTVIITVKSPVYTAPPPLAYTPPLPPPPPVYTPPPTYPAPVYTPYATAAAQLTKTDLGQALFFESSLSEPAGQSCASCHNPFTGWADSVAVSTGAAKKLGSRNTPSISYAVLSPSFSDTGPHGGLFWDGSAVNLLAPTKAHLLNNLVMNNSDKSTVIAKIQASDHAALFEQIYGKGALDTANVEMAFEQLADAVADFLASPLVNPFASKFDLFLQGKASLAADELSGMSLFNGKAGCSGCHTSTQTAQLPAFSNYRYAKLGVPENGAVDVGLQNTTGDPADHGMFKVPSLRNVAKTAPYMHNGVFATLAAVIAFYNSRESGLDLSGEEQAQLIAFLRTLDDISIFTQ